jgi:hypothetical protein
VAGAAPNRGEQPNRTTTSEDAVGASGRGEVAVGPGAEVAIGPDGEVADGPGGEVAVRARWWVVAGLGAAAARAGLRRARTLGARPEEVTAVLPGDELLPDAPLVTTRATTIAAPAAAVWPWLVQMGYQRGGWYSIDRLERLLGAGDFLTGGSAARIVPELQALAVGDAVPLSATRALVVRHLDAPRALVLELPDTPLAWVWSFTLHPAGAGVAGAGAARPERSLATRLVIRTRAGARAGWVRPLLAPLDAGHLVMEAVQLRRLRQRVERVVPSTASVSGTGP